MPGCRSIVLGLVVFAASLAIGLGSVAAKPKPPLGKIVFAAAFGTASSDLFVVNADGSGLRRLTQTPEFEQQPVWAPDGKSIVFVSPEQPPVSTPKGALYRIGVNGGSPRLLLREEPSATSILSDPAWSPNGKRIAFTSSRTGTLTIWTFGLNGSLTQVTQEFGAHPSWSPNGTRIAYGCLVDIGHGTICTIGAGGSGKSDVSHAPVSDDSPVWSPNGTWIAFRSLNADWRQSEVDSLEVVRPDGTGRRRLLSGGVIFPVSWSPTSDAILVLKIASTKPGSRRQLFIVPLKGGRPQPVAGTASAVGGASWHR